MCSYIVLGDYKRKFARDATRAIVPRRKFLGQKPTPSKANLATDKTLDLTPAELKRVEEFRWTKVEKGAKPKQGYSPPPVIAATASPALPRPVIRVNVPRRRASSRPVPMADTTFWLPHHPLF